MGKTMESRCCFKHVPIFVSGCELSVDLVILSTRDFDVILGMHWISKCHATIDYRRKSVFFWPLWWRALSLRVQLGVNHTHYFGSPSTKNAWWWLSRLSHSCCGLVLRGHASSFTYANCKEFSPCLSWKSFRDYLPTVGLSSLLNYYQVAP